MCQVDQADPDDVLVAGFFEKEQNERNKFIALLFEDLLGLSLAFLTVVLGNVVVAGLKLFGDEEQEI